VLCQSAASGRLPKLENAIKFGLLVGVLGKGLSIRHRLGFYDKEPMRFALVFFFFARELVVCECREEDSKSCSWECRGLGERVTGCDYNEGEERCGLIRTLSVRTCSLSETVYYLHYCKYLEVVSQVESTSLPSTN